MRQFLLTIVALLTCALSAQAEEVVVTEYVMLVSGTYVHNGASTDMDDDEIAAADWFEENYVLQRTSDNIAKGRIVKFSDYTSGNVTINAGVTKVIWVNVTQSGTSLDDIASKLGNYVKAGGNLYLTNYATPLVDKIGRIPSNFGANLDSNKGDNKKGINALIGNNYKLFDHTRHAIFNGLTTATIDSHNYFPLVSGQTEDVNGKNWDFGPIFSGKNSDDPYRMVDFEIMTNSIILGAWEHVVDYACACLIEFLPVDVWQGRIIANGLSGYEWNTGTNTYQDNIKKLTENSLTYLATTKTKKVAYLVPNNASEDVDNDDEATALQWFKDEIVTPGKGIIIHPQDLADLDPTEITTVWVHIDRDAENAHMRENLWGDLTGNNQNAFPMLTRYVKNGGNLLLTKHAVQIVSQFENRGINYGINRCSQEPSVEDGRAGDNTLGIKDDPYPWAINAVIGAGATNDTSEPWVSYREPSAGYWEKDNVDNNTLKYDNRENGLYFNLEKDCTRYPVGTGVNEDWKKYEVINIVGPGVREDHNCIWKFDEINNVYQSRNDYITPFQTTYKCTVLGQWAHKTSYDNASIVQFNSTGAWNANEWEGNILCIGLGAYEWQPSNKNGSKREGENPYINNIKQLTYNALNILENPTITEETVQFTYGGVVYDGVTRGLLHYAVVTGVSDNTLEVYDLKKNNGSINDGQITHDGVTYNITNIADNAFVNCNNLAYADLTAFQGVIPSNIRDIFPDNTLIYLPHEDVSTINNCTVKGENIVNKLADNSQVCENLKVYDHEVSGNTYTYHFFANKYAFTAYKVEYNRTYNVSSANYKTSIAMPFDIESDELAVLGKFYEFTSVTPTGNGDATITFTEVSSTEANKPYMFTPATGMDHISIETPSGRTINVLDGDPAFDSGTAKYSLTKPYEIAYLTDATTAGGNFYAEYRVREFVRAVDHKVFAFRNGNYVTTTGTITMDPFRAYVQLNQDSPVTANSIAAIFEDLNQELTGIKEIAEKQGDDAWYTLGGIKVSKPGKGFYIHNGKKVIIK